VTTGALITRYTARGLRAAVVTCTRGEEGEIVTAGADVAAIRERLGVIREAELCAACRVLGVSDLRTLGYRDSGMRRTASTLRADASCSTDLNEATGQLVRILRELRPAVVVTESAWATYGHPDHVMARQVALRAFAAAGNETAFPELGPPWQPARLYAVHPTRSWLWRLSTGARDLRRLARQEWLPGCGTEDSGLRVMTPNQYGAVARDQDARRPPAPTP
jgi:LmbE family N-acetylglucosaminyl deacetylase